MRKRLQRLVKLIPLEIAVTAMVFVLALWVFSVIVREAVYEKDDLFDGRVSQFFTAHRSPGFINVMERVTFFGSTSFLLPAYLLLIGWLLYKKRFEYAIDTAVIGSTSTAIMFGLKQVFHRHRPDLPIINNITGYSFPSGHSLSSVVFCTLLIYLVWKSDLAVAIKCPLIVLLAAWPLVVGMSRVVLNVHYATDVIGGFCLGISWVIVSFGILKLIRKRKAPGTGDPG